MIRLDVRNASACKSDHEQAAVPGDALQRSVEHIAPDGIVDDVCTATLRELVHAGDEVLLAIVDHFVRAERARDLGLLGTTA